MEIINDLKELLKGENKDFNKISYLLITLYNRDIQKLNDKSEIEYRIRFFTENIKELKYLRDLTMEKEKINKEENDKNSGDEKKNQIILKPEEKINLKKAFNNMNQYANEVNNYYNKNKNKYISYYAFKQIIEGFINPNLLKENEFVPYKKKEVLDENQRTQLQYKTICELFEKNPIRIDRLFGKLSNINLELLEENQKNKIIEISINIYNNLTENQRNKIKEKYYKLIKNEEIAKICYLDTENIFQGTDKKNLKSEIIYEKIVEFLSKLLEIGSKRFNSIDNDNYDYRRKIINRDSVSQILLILYKEFLIYKNKENSYINLNKDRIIDKIYYYFIINFLTYDDIFEDGKKFYEFLYVKYLCEYKYNYIKLIEEKENIKNEITIYSEEDLKNKAKNDEKLKNDDLEEFDNEEEEDSNSNILLMNNLRKIIPEEYIRLYSEIQQNISNFYIIPFPINILVNDNNINFTFNIIDMVLFHRNYTHKKDWIKTYKNNLLNLEKNIFEQYIKSTSEYLYVEDNNKLIGYKINKRMQEAYFKLIEYLTRKLPKDKNYEIQFIPFGSVTQFLSGKNGDIDLFMNIESKKKISKEYNKFHQKILNELMKILIGLDKNLVFHQTNRLCLFTFEFEKIKIDINVYGICSYYGEILLREYSLMDFRFPMLVIYLKYIISEYKIKNNEKDKLYINSFAWTNILLTFLQDILNPPLFPRLLNEKNKKNFKN